MVLIIVPYQNRGQGVPETKSGQAELARLSYAKHFFTVSQCTSFQSWTFCPAMFANSSAASRFDLPAINQSSAMTSSNGINTKARWNSPGWGSIKAGSVN